MFQGRDTNLYGYAFKDPVNFIDPNGQFGLVGAVIGGVAATVGTLATGGSVSEALVNGAIGAIAGAIPLGGTLVGAVLRGGALGGAANAAAQGAAIARDPCKSFNFGSLVGSAVGGALTGGRGFPARNSAAAQLGSAPGNIAVTAAAGGLGTALGNR